MNDDDLEKIIEDYVFKFGHGHTENGTFIKDSETERAVDWLRQARTMKGSSWREGYERGRADERTAILALRPWKREEGQLSPEMQDNLLESYKEGYNAALAEWERRIEARNTSV